MPMSSPARLAAVAPISATPIKTRAKVQRKSRAKSSVKNDAKAIFSIPGIVGGAVLGATIPLMAHTMAQAAPFGMNIATLVVAACLLYSAPTVHCWAADACGTPAKDEFTPARPATWKALGFVVCLEAVLVASPVEWCSWLAMALLMGINGTVLAKRIGSKR